jgi:hypothetical protein
MTKKPKLVFAHLLKLMTQIRGNAYALPDRSKT